MAEVDSGSVGALGPVEGEGAEWSMNGGRGGGVNSRGHSLVPTARYGIDGPWSVAVCEGHTSRYLIINFHM